MSLYCIDHLAFVIPCMDILSSLSSGRLSVRHSSGLHNHTNDGPLCSFNYQQNPLLRRNSDA